MVNVSSPTTFLQINRIPGNWSFNGFCFGLFLSSYCRCSQKSPNWQRSSAFMSRSHPGGLRDAASGRPETCAPSTLSAAANSTIYGCSTTSFKTTPIDQCSPRRRGHWGNVCRTVATWTCTGTYQPISKLTFFLLFFSAFLINGLLLIKSGPHHHSVNCF